MNAKPDIEDWNALKDEAAKIGIVIGNYSVGTTGTRFFAYHRDYAHTRLEKEHIGGLWNFDARGWFAQCRKFVRGYTVRARWQKRQHKHAISRAYQAICDLADLVHIDSPLDGKSPIACNIVFNPSDPESRLEAITTDDGLVELHAENLLTIGGTPSRRWNYTVVTVHGGGSGHDDPPPAVDESKPMPLGDAVRAFVLAALNNKITFANLNL